METSDEEYIRLDKDSSEFAFSDASLEHNAKDRKKKYRHCKHEREIDSNLIHQILHNDIRSKNKKQIDSRKKNTSGDNSSQMFIEKEGIKNYESAMKIEETVDSNGEDLVIISNETDSHFKKYKVLIKQKENLKTSLMQCLQDKLELMEGQMDWNTNEEVLDVISIKSSGSDTPAPRVPRRSSCSNNDTKKIFEMDKRIVIKVNVENEQNLSSHGGRRSTLGRMDEDCREETTNETEGDYRMIWEDDGRDSEQKNTHAKSIEERFRGRLGERISDQDRLWSCTRKRSQSKGSSRNIKSPRKQSKHGKDRRKQGRERDGEREKSRNRKLKKHAKDSSMKDKKIEYAHSDSSSKSIDTEYEHKVIHKRRRKSKRKVQKKLKTLKSKSQSETNSVVSSESGTNMNSSESDCSDTRSYTPPLPCKKISNDDGEIYIQKLTMNAGPKEQ